MSCRIPTVSDSCRALRLLKSPARVELLILDEGGHGIKATGHSIRMFMSCQFGRMFTDPAAPQLVQTRRHPIRDPRPILGQRVEPNIDYVFEAAVFMVLNMSVVRRKGHEREMPRATCGTIP
jgi:hypothetical protein